LSVISCTVFLFDLIIYLDRFPTESPQLPRYGANRYTHIFYTVLNPNLLGYWSDMYSRVSLTQQRLDFFEYSSKNYPKYRNFESWAFKTDYYHSQWNQDRFVIHDSHELILGHISEGTNFQKPTFFQNKEDRVENIQRMYLMYSTLSGWGGNRCRFYTRQEQLFFLTEQYNAFDMLFCEVFNYFNITPQVDFNFKEVRWTRNFFFRDDLTTSFPPESNAVFYESPGITFVMLREPPLFWNNIIRPFTFDVWMFVLACLVIIPACTKVFYKEMSSQPFAIFKPSCYYSLNSFIGGFSILNRSGNTEGERVDSSRCWGFSVHIYRLILTSAYSGMILGNFLNKSYPWSPSTFRELNSTSSVILTTFKSSAVGPDMLINKSYLLNGVKGFVIDREDPTYGTKPALGHFLDDDEKDLEHRYALFMYDDKKYHFIYSKQQLYLTHKYLDKLEINKEVVRRVMRYISVPPSATKLHFIIDGIRNCFESGTWIRWKYLEQNYFKYVAPIISKVYYGSERTKNENRPLSLYDLISTGLVWAFGLGGCLVIFVLEAYKRIVVEMLTAVGNCCLYSGFGMLKVKKRISTLNQFD